MRRLAILGLGTLLFAWFELVLSPRPLMGQIEGRGGVATGIIVGTATSSVAMTGSCAAGYIFFGIRAEIGQDVGEEGNSSPELVCAYWGAVFGLIPALTSGYGLRHPDRATGQGRLRTLALGAAGGGSLGLPFWLVTGSAEALLYTTAWGAAVGLVTALVGPPVQAYLFPSPAAQQAENASPSAIGLALRFPLPEPAPV